jgi:hypothetical protein
MYDSGDRELIGKADRLACNAAIQGCLKYTERVLTNKGYLQIGEVFERWSKDHEQFTTWTGHGWETFHPLNRGACELATIELHNGMQLNCDTRHEVLVEGENGYVFRKYADLAKGDRVCVSAPTEREFGQYPVETTFSGGTANNSVSITVETVAVWDRVAYLSGVSIGDGSISGLDGGTHHTLALCFGKAKLVSVLPEIRTTLHVLGVNCTEPRKVVGAKGESYEVAIHSKALVSMLAQLGHEKAVARTKRVPQKIFESPLSMRKQFLRGYLMTDGCSKRANRYSVHTPNKQLLVDIQLLGRTVGLDSRICSTNADTFILSWCELNLVETLLGVQVTNSTLRASGTDCIPAFLVSKIYDLIEPAYDKSCAKDRALVSKLRNGKAILVKTAEVLLARYGITPPLMYHSSPLESKVSIGVVEDTYTLSVNADCHRFEAAGIINKNTGADVIKIAMFRVWSFIRKNNLQDDVRMLIPIHDEIVYEIREDKLDTLIPALCQVMKIRDLTDSLKWPVKLEVDAEYGDNFMVSNNYYKDLAKGITPSIKIGLAMAAEEEAEATPVEQVAATEPLSELDIQVLPPLEDLPPPKPIKEAPTPASSTNLPKAPSAAPDSHSSSEFYNYEVQNKGELAELHTDMTWCILRKMDEHMTGPRKRIRLTRDKKVIYTTPVAYSVDGFLALAYNYIL